MLSTLTPAQVKARRQLDELRERLSNAQAPPFADTTPDAQKRRLATTKGKPGEFARVYTPHLAESPDATFHEDVDALFRWPTREVHGVHGPRDHAKSTRARVNVLEGCVNGEIHFWLFISETLALARDHCEMLVAELETNDRLRHDYDIVTVKKSEATGVYQFRVTCKATGQATEFRLLCCSWKTPVKGKLWRQYRPDGALVDDFESTETSRNPELGARKVDFILQEVYPAVRRTVVWLGNTGRKTSALYQFALLVHDEKDDALKSFLRRGTTPGSARVRPKRPRAEKRQGNGSGGKDGSSPQARVRFWSFRATTTLPDGTVRLLWPERYARAWYDEMLATMKRRRFSGEMNGEPISDGKVFLPEWFPTYKALPRGADVRLYLWCDPAFGTSASACYKAVVVVATDGKRYYVVDAWLRQGEPVSSMILAMYALFLLHDERGLRHGGHEKNFAQDERLARDLDDAADEHGYPLPVSGDENRGNKEGRIESLEPLMSTGRLLWPERGGRRTHPHSEDDVERLKDQLLGYPDDYDDGPDALESAVRRIRFTRASRPHYASLGKRRSVRSPGRAGSRRSR